MFGLNKIAKTFHLQIREKGFWDNRDQMMDLIASLRTSDPELALYMETCLWDNMLMLVVSEITENQEARRKGRHGVLNFEDKQGIRDLSDEDFKAWYDANVKDTARQEIIGTIYRLLEICGGADIDLDFRMALEYRYNMLRKSKHGKNF